MKRRLIGIAAAISCALALVVGMEAYSATKANQNLKWDDTVVTQEEDPTISLSGTTLTVKGTAVELGVNNTKLNNLAALVNTWQGYWNGTNAWLEITNYMHMVAGVIPEFSIWEIRDGEQRKVWSDLEKFNAFTDQYRIDLTNETAKCEKNCQSNMVEALKDKADKAWSLYDSGTGMAAPEGTTWISTPVTVIAGGMNYERHVTTAGAVWVLKSNGLVSEFGAATTNSLTAYFTISDDAGNTIFSIKKTDSFTEGASITQFSHSGETGTIVFRHRQGQSGHPSLYFKTSLDTEVSWIEEGESGFPYAVTWTENSTTHDWSASLAIQAPYTVPSAGFFKGMVQVEGETITEHSAPVKMQYIIIGNPAKKYSVAPVTISGQTVMGLTEVQ